MSAMHQKWIFLLFLPLPAFAQQTAVLMASSGAHAAAAPAASGKPAQRITLDVVVTDKSGRPVRGLQLQDFTVLDNKQQRNILSFHAMDANTAGSLGETILLVDAVNTGVENIGRERQDIGKYLRQNGGKMPNPTSLLFFSDEGTKVQSQPTTDANALIADLANMDAYIRTIRRSAGFYGAAERVELSLKTVSSLTAYLSARQGRKVLIWISPGWPILSGPDMMLTEKDERGMFSAIVGASTSLRLARVTIYNVDPLGTSDAGGFRTTYYEEFLKGVKSSKQVDYADLSLQVLAYQSGGLVLNSSNDVAGEIARCATDADAYYALTIETPVAQQPDEYHALDVKIGKPGLTARTRTGYYAQP